MTRKIIKIDESKCNGCGDCIPGCPEGALQIIDGKARLVSDLFCDGLGACIGNCPRGAISVEEREAEPYDEKKVMQNIIKAGPNTIKAHLKHLKDHGELHYLKEAIDVLKQNKLPIPNILEMEKPCSGGCPGSQTQIIHDADQPGKSAQQKGDKSQLRQWPVQLALINPLASFFDDADLLIAADCVPFAFADFHQHFLKNKVVITFCPKLDQALDRYIDKLATIFQNHNIISVQIVRMQVPCCGGTELIVKQALQKANRSQNIKIDIIDLNGTIL